MRDLKILAVVVIFTAIVYIGVEPIAHSAMHPHVAPADFNFKNEDIGLAKHILEMAEKDEVAAQKSLEKAKDKKAAQKTLDAAKKSTADAKENLEKYTAFWDEIYAIDFSKGDATKGEEVFMNAGCVGCHGVKAKDMPSPMDDASASAAFGVVPPDLSSAGYLYDEHFLAGVIKKPAIALKLTHKFNDEKPFPMTDFYASTEDPAQELADLVAYLKSIAPAKMDDKTAYIESCQRCHDMKYDKLISFGDKNSLTSYMGSLPPDLSMMIRSKGYDYLHTFINDPQKQLAGTAMPRVGLNEKAQEQVISYLEQIGDRKKAERESLGLQIIGFFIILSIFSILWKNKVWRELH